MMCLKHNIEFDPGKGEGCSQCIADRMAEGKPVSDAEAWGSAIDQALRKIVKVKFLKDGEPDGREYTYFATDPLAVGNRILAPARGDRELEAEVTQINVLDSEIEAFRDKVKTIPKGAKLVVGSLAKAAQDAGAEVTVVQAKVVLDPDEDRQGQDYLDKYVNGQMPKAEVPDMSNASHEEDPISEEEQEAILAEENDVPAEASFVNAISQAMVAYAPDQNIVVARLQEEIGKAVEYARIRIIEDHQGMELATTDAVLIAKLMKSLEKERTYYTGPLNAHLKEINAFFKILSDPLKEADQITRKQMLAYNAESDRKRAEAERIEADRLKLAQEEMALKGEHTQDLAEIEKPAPTPQIVRGPIGSTSKIGQWKATVDDFALLPDEWKLANESLLNSHARTTKGERSIPGVSFEYIPGLSVRS